jgi:tetratricopeptide (TPR) repeat protein
MRHVNVIEKGLLWILVVSLMAIVSCAPKGRKAVGIMDTPEHHYNQGVSFLDKDNLDAAAGEFDLALGLDKKYGPALAGKGLVQVMQGDDDGLKMITSGWRRADGKWEKVQVVSAEIRAYIAMKKDGRIQETEMIRKAKEAFSRGLLVERDAPALYYYMGEAYLQGLDFRESETMFATAKSLGGDFEERAYERWTFVQKANRAAPESMIGKKIALVEKLSRADMAALLIEELNIERFYTRTQEPEKVSFEAPKGITMKGEDLYTTKDMTDIEGNPLKNDIEKVVSLGVEGLKPYPDHTFRPQAPVSRIEAAQLFQDIIVRATGKTSLATEYLGEESRIPDVPRDHWGFNAVRLSTERGIMSTDVRTNSFYPKAVMTGVDALLSMKELKRALTVF